MATKTKKEVTPVKKKVVPVLELLENFRVLLRNSQPPKRKENLVDVIMDLWMKGKPCIAVKDFKGDGHEYKKGDEVLPPLASVPAFRPLAETGYVTTPVMVESSSEYNRLKEEEIAINDLAIGIHKATNQYGALLAKQKLLKSQSDDAGREAKTEKAAMRDKEKKLRVLLESVLN